jgi:4'-phosphopantetheinyl transferase
MRTGPPRVGSIDIWTAPLSASAREFDRLSVLLSPDERARQARLLAGPVRDRFTVARATLRRLVGRYLGVDPAVIQFTYGARGKPALAGMAEDLRFNLAHSEDLALYAFAARQEVGVDVERVREIPDMERIARRFFAPDEHAALEALPTRDRVRAFYLAWTRKEAYVKAVGDGLQTPLDSFSVTLGPGEPASILRIDGVAKSGPDWNMHHIELAPGFVGAVAYAGARKQLTLHPFTELDPL